MLEAQGVRRRRFVYSMTFKRTSGPLCSENFRVLKDLEIELHTGYRNVPYNTTFSLRISPACIKIKRIQDNLNPSWAGLVLADLPALPDEKFKQGNYLHAYFEFESRYCSSLWSERGSRPRTDP